MSALGSLDARLRPFAPPERLAALRILVGVFAVGYTAARAAHLAAVARHAPSQFRPIGVVRLLDAPLPPLAVHLLVGLTLAMGVAFVAGYKFRVAGPAFAALLLWVTTYRSAWGVVFHTENLLVLDVMVLGLAPSADAVSLDARRAPWPAEGRAYGAAILLLCALTALTYVLAGVTKLRVSGADWVGGEVLRSHVAHDNLRKLELGDTHSPFGGVLVRHAWPWPPLAIATLAVELGAPLALAGRRAGRVWCAAAWAFHVGVLAVMAIFFPFPVLGFAFAPFFEVERLPGLASWARRAPPASSARTGAA